METLHAVKHDGKERLYPSLTNPNWLILRRRRQIFQTWLVGLKEANLCVLDLGGRIQPYRPLLEGHLGRYVAIDLRQGPLVDAVARGEQIPFVSGQFDLVICTQVLEYIPEPAAVLAEVRRVLKPGGRLLLSAPAVFPRDSDHDLWRFSPGSLQSLLRDFQDVELRAEGSSLIGLVRTFNVCSVIFAKPAWLGRVLCFTLVPVLNVGAHVFESFFVPSNDQFTANFSVFARK